MYTVLPHPRLTIPIIRNIAKHRWYAGIEYLQNNPSEEYTVISHHDCWTYIARRIKDVFYCETYRYNQCVDKVKYEL